jgi:hypothetical protein
MKCFSCGERFGAGEYVEVGGVCYCWACSIGAIEVPSVEVPATVEAKPVQPIEPQSVRACRVRAMREFFRAAKKDGLNTEDADGMRAALADYLGRMVNSRRDLSAGEWCEATEGINCLLLAW